MHMVWRGRCIYCTAYLEYIGQGMWQCECPIQVELIDQEEIDARVDLIKELRKHD